MSSEKERLPLMLVVYLAFAAILVALLLGGIVVYIHGGSMRIRVHGPGAEGSFELQRGEVASDETDSAGGEEPSPDHDPIR